MCAACVSMEIFELRVHVSKHCRKLVSELSDEKSGDLTFFFSHHCGMSMAIHKDKIPGTNLAADLDSSPDR